MLPSNYVMRKDVMREAWCVSSLEEQSAVTSITALLHKVEKGGERVTVWFGWMTGKPSALSLYLSIPVEDTSRV